MRCTPLQMVHPVLYTKYNTAQSIHKLPAGANSIPGSSLSLQSHGIWVTRIRHFRGRSNSDRHSVLKYNTKYRIQNRMGEILTDCATQCATQKTEKSAINSKKLQCVFFVIFSLLSANGHEVKWIALLMNFLNCTFSRF